MKKIISYIIMTVFSLPIVVSADEDYFFDGFENSPNTYEMRLIRNEKTRYCEQIYLEAMRRRAFTNEEINYCKNIFIKRIKEELEYKRRVMQERSIY